MDHHSHYPLATKSEPSALARMAYSVASALNCQYELARRRALYADEPGRDALLLHAEVLRGWRDEVVQNAIRIAVREVSR